MNRASILLLLTTLGLLTAAPAFAQTGSDGWYYFKKVGNDFKIFKRSTSFANEMVTTNNCDVAASFHTLEGAAATSALASNADAFEATVVGERPTPSSGDHFGGVENRSSVFDTVNSQGQGFHYLRLEDFTTAPVLNQQRSLFIVLRKEAGVPGKLFAGWTPNTSFYARDLELIQNYYSKMCLELSTVGGAEKVTKFYYNGNAPGTPSFVDMNGNIALAEVGGSFTPPPDNDDRKIIERPNTAHYVVIEFVVKQLSTTSKMYCRYYEVASMANLNLISDSTTSLVNSGCKGTTTTVTAAGAALALRPFLSSPSTLGLSANNEDAGIYGIGIMNTPKPRAGL